VCDWTMLAEKSPMVRPFHFPKVAVAFLAWPVTPGNLFRIFCHLRQMCVESFTLPHFVLSFPMNTIVNSAHFSAAIIIRRTLFRTLQVTYRFPRISIACRPVVSAVTITYIIKCHCTNSLGILCISAVQAIHNGRQKPKTALLPAPYPSDTNCQIQRNKCAAERETHSTGF
jgi:hypothetical protein